MTVNLLKKGNPTIKSMAMSSHTYEGRSITCNKLAGMVRVLLICGHVRHLATKE